MKKNKDQNPVSLFSFQDIITCLTGIMLLLTLLFILRLIESGNSQGNPEKEKLLKNLKKIKKTNKTLREEVNKNNDKIVYVWPEGDIDLSLEKLKEDSKKINEKLDKISTRIQNFEVDKKNLRLKIDKLKKKLQKTENSYKPKNEKLIKLQKELDKLKKKLALKSNIVTFNPDPEDELSPIFVECSEKKICVKSWNGKLKTFTSEITLFPAINKFSKWLKSRSKYDEYVVLLIKPSASKYYKKLNFILKDLDFKRSFQPLLEKQSVIEGM